MVIAVVVLAGAAAGGCSGGTTTNITVVSPKATSPSTSPSFPRLYRVPSGSMEPTLHVGQHVIVQALKSMPRIGDIVVFRGPQGYLEGLCAAAGMGRGTTRACSVAGTEASLRFIKRIVAGPGDTLSIPEGHVIRNGKREPDQYIRPCANPKAPECNFPTPVKIPANEWFVLGDNRGESDDSRFWGPVPTGWIVGVVGGT